MKACLIQNVLPKNLPLGLSGKKAIVSNFNGRSRVLLRDCKKVVGGSFAALVSREPLQPPAASNNPAGGRSQAPGQGEGGAWIPLPTSFCFVLLHHLNVELR